MSNHFYYRYNICEICGRYDEVHLGMSDIGWQFLFQALYGDQWKPPLEEIKSWDDWSIFMAKHPGKIFNEFNNYIPLKNFLKAVSYSKGQKARNVCDQKELNVLGLNIKPISIKNTFQDNKGYWFTFCEWKNK